MDQTQPQLAVGRRVFNGLQPEDGPKALAVDFNFAIANPINFDLVTAELNNQLGAIQTIYIDNGANPAALTIRSVNNDQDITIAAGWQGYFPFLVTDQPFFKVSTIGTPTVKIKFLNVAMPALSWPVSNVTPTSGAGSTGTDYSANDPAQAANLILTIPVNASRNLVGIQNQDSAQIQVLLDNGAGAQTTFLLLESGGTLNTGGGAWTSTTFKGRVRVYSANATPQVAAYEN